MKTTSIMIVAKRTFSEMGERGITLLLGALMILLLASLAIPAAAFSQSPRESGAIAAPHSIVQPPRMIPPGVVPHKMHVNVPGIDLRYASQAGKFVSLSQDRRHPRRHNRGRNGGSAASSAAAGGGGNGGSAASSAAAGGGGDGGGGSAASSAAAGGGGGGGSAASSAAAGG
ncbi:MAG TPA: hypothetical protein VF458_11225 [Ktedonobacteraceae bacterium]